MAKSRFLIKFLDKDGVTSYFKNWSTERKMCDGVLMSYAEYQLTTNINEAWEYFDEGGAAYQAAQRNGWLKDYIWMTRPKVIKKWTYDKCYNEAKKYLKIGEFSKKSSGAYHAAQRNNWFDDYTWFKNKKTFNSY